MHRAILLLAMTSFGLQAADGWIGTWKLDPSRSRFENTDALKDLLLVITAEGGSHVLNFTITTADGKVVHQGFKQPDKGGKVTPIGDTPVENGVLQVTNDHEWVYNYYSKDGRLEATRRVTLSKDEKSHEADMRGVQNGKHFVEHEFMLRK